MPNRNSAISEKIFLKFLLLLILFAIQGRWLELEADTSNGKIAAAVEKLKTGTDYEKTAAMNMLLKMGNECSMELATLLSDPNEDTRQRTVRLLGKIQARNAVNDLNRLVVADPSYAVRQSAMVALSDIKDPTSFSALSKAMNEDSNPDNRGVAALALGLLGNRQAIDILKPHIQGTYPINNAKVARALFYLGDNSGYEPAIKLLKNPNPKVRREAAYALGYSRNKSAISVLRPLLKEASGVGFKVEEAINRIEIQNLPEADKLLRLKEMLNDNSPILRTLAADEMMRIGGSEVEGFLRHTANDENAKGREEANSTIINMENSYPKH